MTKKFIESVRRMRELQYTHGQRDLLESTEKEVDEYLKRYDYYTSMRSGGLVISFTYTGTSAVKPLFDRDRLVISTRIFTKTKMKVVMFANSGYSKNLIAKYIGVPVNNINCFKILK